MLANYAKAMGKFEAADESALDSMSDANTVSDWAEANVAWAVENGVMGNGGFVAGQSNITRAEVAAMAVNYQPEALEK
ncbi:S-layer homology domain-containing protein [Collinsella tanakaei]|nr:S-layer homology domain-containing protein [Collinsella tanakaei]